ncbi:MAG: hypothetical protein ACYC3S_02615 [Chloroflexota bacterium]
MDVDGEAFVQGRLFGVPAERAPRLNRYATGRVTRDPAVAQAHAEAYRVAHGVKLGMARILASRSVEEREALRALLSKPRVD